MIKPDPEGKPKTYRVIYFGESGNMSERGFLKSHHKFGCWINEAGTTKNLYISTYLMPNSSETERRTKEGQLIREYDPICNK
jgi:hypothetical protein